jgi:hypothetical protein
LSELLSLAESSRTVTRAPNSISPSAAAKPETPMPATTTCACGHGDVPSASASQLSIRTNPLGTRSGAPPE